MWVDSKTAAAVLGVNLRTLQRKAINAQNKCQKILTIDTHKIMYQFIFSSRGGSSGKVLQIWLDEQSENKLISKGYNIEDISDTRTSRAFAKQGLHCNLASTQWQGEYKSSKDRQEDTTKETSLEPKSHKGSVNDEKYNKTLLFTQEESLDKNSQNRTIADIGLPCVVGTSVFANFSGGLATTLKVHKEKETINDKENKANLEEIRNPHISSGKRDNADNSVDEFQSYAIEQKNSLAELFDDMNINDDKKADAFLKAKVVKLWLKARDRKVKIDAFLQYININNMYGKRVSKGQIYDWARRYANGGIKGLVDERGGNRPLLVELLGYKEKVDELILASQGKISSYNIYNRLHHHFVSLGLLSHDEFIGKQKEIVAYDSINRYVNKWKKENPTTVLYIEKGYDWAVNSKLAGVGKADWKADFANEYVEIDATTLDLFAKKINLDLASAIWKMNKEAFRDFEECCERVKENQKRYTVVGLIDVHSGVCSYVIGKSENIYTVKRCLAKYIAKFGKPLRVVGDNGKAFKSNEMAGTFESLDIEYLAVRAYSGWLKPYIEKLEKFSR